LAHEESKKSCEIDEFRCVSNGECIPQYFLCDEKNDCMDRSDENSTVCLQLLGQENYKSNEEEKRRYKKKCFSSFYFENICKLANALSCNSVFCFHQKV
jgi:hypothetical protein